ncbi:DEAD/DEAH box helicase [Amycolatopsis magusensis]|uniref:DNA 3'-5' helicase n=1 Tax=Amycolatopsis magusensis TaxID=882444 RepID=A0ABS4PWN9_9PSEU|nr:DEAD/DEAH box helicase [Amycolatopsis magusensis]MBP2183842.1 ATP-dependent DNA helicase RecQ [Amycolatopsis magusensis]
MTVDDLHARARLRYPNLPVRRVATLIAQALSAGELVEKAGRLRVPVAVDVATPAACAVPPTSGVIRAVAIDLESVVRTTASEPYLDQRIFQVGAVRMGTDTEWTAAAPSRSWFLELPDPGWEIRAPALRARHNEEAVSPAVALEELRRYVDGAEALVAYNGTEADFPLLRAAYERAEVPALEAVPVDAYYLALALWPGARSHRLADLADDLGVERAGLSWHDAGDDADLLVRLLTRAGEQFARWPASLRDLVASVGVDSPAWTLVRHLGVAARGGDPGQVLGAERAHSTGEVAAVLDALLSGHRPRRHPASRPDAGSKMVVAPSLRGPDGRVDPVLLAGRSHGAAARRRPAQERMASALHEWVEAGVPALVEAPTGTGKSFAILAAVLEWLAGSPRRTAVVATYTKQLQAQLAGDLALLERDVPGLLEASDVVKGGDNRLSLRALTVALADATTLDSTRRAGASAGNRFLAQVRFRELVIYVVLRLAEAAEAPRSWIARSVDPVDVPAFFGGYAGPVLPVWLESLSQGSNGDYPADAATGVAVHTDAVREALTSHRLVLANHALLLAHLDEVRALGSETLLVIDEAHQLEDAATSALTTSVDYRAVENLFSEVTSWAQSARRGGERDAVREAAANLGFLLDHEQLPRVAGRAFDARGPVAGTVVGSRTVTLASAYAGAAGVGQVRTLTGLLLRLGGQCRALAGSVARYLTVHSASLDYLDAERIRALLTRCASIADACATIVEDIDELIGRAADVAAGSGAPVEVAALEYEPAETAIDDRNEDENDSVDDDDSVLDPREAARGSLPPDTSNRVVYAEELEALRADLRSYRFRVSTSPVELAADPAWQQFLSAFERTYYVSATLRVADTWDFIRERLGLAPGMATLHLPTPFDYTRQAALVCFSDFPSWAEHAEGAMRTVAYQLAGYAREMVTEAGDERGGYNGGALVLTTARSTAGGIADFLAGELHARQDRTPVLSSLVLGNPRGVREFTDAEHGGGVLVGTKGLWQGVDVADERRLRMVWINKLPFAPFAAPVIEARRAAITARAEAAHAEDPEAIATQFYYLPLAALQLRQAVGRLIRSERHVGVVVVSDRKLGGQTALRRAYRQTFLGSLDEGLLVDDPVTGERGGGNVGPMSEGWTRIWRFFAEHGLLASERAAVLSTPEALEEHTVLPQTRRIRQLALTPAEVDAHRAGGTLEEEVLARAASVGGLLRLSDSPAVLKPSQQQVIRAVTSGRNVLGLLPTGFGKSFCFQLPALVLPGVTLVVSPLVALMLDQALELNRSIGGAVRALVAPLRESSSRAGKTEVAEQLLGRADHGIRLVYVSPERLCQRRFRDLVRAAVASGVVTRIAVDEAHTFVQWDDFRPAMSRGEHFLADLRGEFGLPVTALTATANRTVHTAMREGLFGLSADPSSTEAAEAAAGTLITVRENPIRPELAIFRRSLATAGPALYAGLTETVLEAVQDHAIFYCLTVKEVVALHAHLRDLLGEGGARVRRFHGRLTEAEKSAVMTEFREAPSRGDEGFAPLVIVATSAFGLGVNRADVRTVFCVSAPTDLAALYQQIGRAGRDAAGGAAAAAGPAADTIGSAPVDGGGDGPTQPPPANVGLAVLTSRGLNTVAFMTGSDLPVRLMVRMGEAVLACGHVLDAASVADRLIGEELDAGRLTPTDARASRTADAYTAGVLRAFSALAGLGAVSDQGDFPPWCAVKPGELLHAGPRADERGNVISEQVIAAVLALPARTSSAQALRRQRLDVAALDGFLATAVPGYRAVVEDPAGTWHLLADLHDRGLLDVSAAPSRRLVTGITVHTPVLPASFLGTVSGKAARAREEIRLLRDFFDDVTTCAHRKFADYFGVPELPPGCCTTALNRCSAHWNTPTWPAGEVKPAVGAALETPLSQLARRRTDAAHRLRRLDEQVFRLVWEVYAGAHPYDLVRALRGEDSYFNPRTRRRVRLRAGLANSRYFGVNPTIRLGDVEDALTRLQAENRVVPADGRWREAGHVRRDARQQARAGRPPRTRPE